MKILIITPRIPYPPYRGDKLKIYNLLKILKKNNNVHLVTFIKNSSEEQDLQSLIDEGFFVDTIKLSKVKSYLNIFRILFNSSPLQVLYYHSNKMSDKIKALTKAQNYDVVYFHLINSAQYFESVKNKKSLKIIDFTDATSLYLSRYIEFLKNPLRKLFFKFELSRVLKYEKVVDKFDTLFVCSPVDKKFLTDRNIHKNIQLLINGFDIESFKFEKTKKEKGRIVFIGNMTYFPNIDAVLYFTKEIFPLILKKIPYAKFYIVGQSPTQEVLKLQCDNIAVTGFVKDLKKEYLISEVNIAPIRFGSGTLNKIIEALALGVPSVATSLATQGFTEDIKKYIMIKDKPNDIADEIVFILSNYKSYESMINKGINVVKEELTWDRIVSNFETYLRDRIPN